MIERVKVLYPDNLILVYSHYAGVEEEYYESADYYIYDYSNPTSPRNFYDWTYIPQIDRKFISYNDDFGLAVIQMIKRSALFMYSLKIETSLFLNYDMDIDEIDNLKMLEISNYLVNHLAIFNVWGDHISRQRPVTIEQFSLCSFWLNIKEIGRNFFESITREKYLSYNESFISERIFYEIFTEAFGQKCLVIRGELGGKISGAGRSVDESSCLSKYFDSLVASKSKESGKKTIAAWSNLTKNSNITNVESIVVEIDGKEFVMINELEDKRFFFSPLPEEETTEIKIKKVNNDILESPHSIYISFNHWNRNLN
jgi:hypothetical protein